MRVVAWDMTTLRLALADQPALGQHINHVLVQSLVERTRAPRMWPGRRPACVANCSWTGCMRVVARGMNACVWHWG